MNEIKWYSLDKILQYDAEYYYIIGARSRGKSYAVQKYMIDEYFKHGAEFVVVKRYKEDLTSRIASTMLSHLNDYVFHEYRHAIYFYRGSWYVYPVEQIDDERPPLKNCKKMGYAISLTDADRTKGSSLPKVETICFEEVQCLQMNKYLKNEVNLFTNLVSTITRNRVNVKVFMLSNNNSKTDPYFEALGISLHHLERDTITLIDFKHDDLTTRFAIERTSDADIYHTSENEKGTTYANFGNQINTTITTGDFVSDQYPKLVNGVSFYQVDGCRFLLSQKSKSCGIVLVYLDYLYTIHRVQTMTGVVFGFCLISKLPNKTIAILSSTYTHPLIPNISNIAYYDGVFNHILNELAHAVRQNNYVCQSDDDYTNVINELKRLGLEI